MRAPTFPTFRTQDLAWVGQGLQRPECVLATRSGDLYSADWRGGVAHIRPDGSQALYAGRVPVPAPAGRPARPNGIALTRDGRFLFADLGESMGGVFALSRDGTVSDFLLAVDGIDLPPTNFVAIDAQERIWVTVSTRRQPRALAYNRVVADGFIALCDRRGVRIVADGLGFTNEALVSPDGRWLYVNETYHKRMSRYPLRADGSLGSKEVVTEFGRGAFPDGFAFDSEGCPWVACVIGNQLIRVLPDGAQQVLLDDGDPAHVDLIEAAWIDGSMGRAHMDRALTTGIRNLSSIAFGGPDLRTIYLGTLGNDAIAQLRMPDGCDLSGHPPAHWAW